MFLQAKKNMATLRAILAWLWKKFHAWCKRIPRLLAAIWPSRDRPDALKFTEIQTISGSFDARFDASGVQTPKLPSDLHLLHTGTDA